MNFKNKDTEIFWLTGQNRIIPADLKKRAYSRLQALDAAADLKDLLIPPGNQLEKLKGNRKDQYSIRINKQWRVCFVWENGDAANVEIVDYH